MIVPWHGHATPLCALGFRKNPEKETQRTLCFKELVSLAPQKEELEKDEYTVVSNLRTCVLANPGDGALTG